MYFRTIQILVILTTTSTALAYTRSTIGACSSGYQWTSDQTFLIQPSGFSSALTQSLMRAATDEVMTRVNNVGGQWFDYRLPLGTASSEPQGQNDINEITLGPLTTGSSSVTLGLTTTWVNTSSCNIVESDVVLNDQIPWVWGVPDDEGVPYYDAENAVDTSIFPLAEYFARTVLLHELGHSLGLGHSDHSYAFMNYKNRPWSNRIEHKQIEFLPDDREALRHIYPRTGHTEKDVAVLNTWFDSSDVSSSGAARQKLLCKPSTGSSWSSSQFDTYCGVNGSSYGSTEVCPGDLLRVRYAMANYGTKSISIDEELWFSSNDWLNRSAGYDIQSPDIHNRTVSANSSFRDGRRFEVPRGLTYDREYFVMVFLNTHSNFSSEESQQNNWIPMRGKVRVKPLRECLRISGPILKNSSINGPLIF